VIKAESKIVDRTKGEIEGKASGKVEEKTANKVEGKTKGKAVHFGAGNIGRGFIGILLHQAGYEVVFADVVPNLIEEINKARLYRVITLDAIVQIDSVDNIRAVLLDSEDCRQEIVHARVVTTAVGLGNLQNVASIIADGLRTRMEQNPDEFLNIMACENAIRATTILKNHVFSHCNLALRDWIETHVGFADVAVDRIAPNRAGYATEPLDAVVERFFEWDIEEPALIGKLEIPGATFVKQLDPFLERKLFILNGAHATAAYAGYQKRCATILDAMKDDWIAELVAKVQHEAIAGLVHRYPDFTADQLEQYAGRVRERFQNPYIRDEVERVGRDPLRKLSAEDRLVRSLNLAHAANHETPGLIAAIALGLLYDHTDDVAAVEVQKEIRESGLEQAVARITGLGDLDTIKGIVAAFVELQKEL
jgi:mannitol-1-phosphate 5-dehydrogenase